jgi:putative effector of murein hydrolase LrgA (UPF0299 family)
MFGVAFVLTVCIVIGGVLFYTLIIRQTVTFNNNYVFSFFLATFLTLLILGWIGEKITDKISKAKKKK